MGRTGTTVGCMQRIVVWNKNNCPGKDPDSNKKEKNMDKVIITVVGKDTVGIIAKVCTYLADSKINVLDISQTIVSGYFNMMMIADFASSTKPFAEVSSDLDTLGERIGVAIKCQKEEIFEKMHRI
jgi:ACT domain-containing protein